MFDKSIKIISPFGKYYAKQDDTFVAFDIARITVKADGCHEYTNSDGLSVTTLYTKRADGTFQEAKADCAKYARNTIGTSTHILTDGEQMAISVFPTDGTASRGDSKSEVKGIGSEFSFSPNDGDLDVGDVALSEDDIRYFANFKVREADGTITVREAPIGKIAVSKELTELAKAKYAEFKNFLSSNGLKMFVCNDDDVYVGPASATVDCPTEHKNPDEWFDIYGALKFIGTAATFSDGSDYGPCIEIKRN